MKVEVISIGNELLLGDILDTNATHIIRSLDELEIGITCKVTVGDDLETIADALRSALRRADVALVTGGLGQDANDFTRPAVAQITGRTLIEAPPSVAGATILGVPGQPAHGLLFEKSAGTLICLPGSHRHMAYLLETEVLPFLQKQRHKDGTAGWVLLRTAGIMESTIIQQLSGLELDRNQRLTYASFAGQTDIRLWVNASSREAYREGMLRLINAVYRQLGDNIYGRDKDRLENILARQLMTHNIRLAVAECHTGRVLSQIMATVPGAQESAWFAPVNNQIGLAAYLGLEPLTLDSDLTRWCRLAAEMLRSQAESDLALVLYNNVSRSGVQILITLATESGLSVMQRSFGGHPDNISQWATTLALVHVRRWLLTHRPAQPGV